MAGTSTASSMFPIDAFRAKFKDGARGYLFYITPVFPSISSLGTTSVDYAYLVRSSSIPNSTLGEIQTPWQGHKYKLAATQQFNNFTIDFTVDTNATLYTIYKAWCDYIHNPATNVHGDPTVYMVDQTLQMIGGDGVSLVMGFQLYGAWPQSISEIRLDYNAQDLATFSVTYVYQYHQIISSLTNLSS